ncbi:zinc finger and SCAN domain-containing protein 12 isoform X1 [Neodiprion pinetum]|uniref:zinc finger and SCAN domain-containing protein 12 isoform X1 n=2 Tax=Neodiprion pinetum TaxID=441929 RepID=UPI001EDF7110|nr:protein suppressor of hairy wing-like isoform X1 [Neodiprion pinetum]
MNKVKEHHNCVLCDSKLDSKEALQEHFRKHANKEIDARGRPCMQKTNAETRCDICGQSFDTIPATIRHRFKVHPNSPTKFYCPYCGMQFPLKTHRDNHQATHDPESSTNTNHHKCCKQCDVLFYNGKALDYHYRSIHKRMVHLFQPILTPPPSNKIKVNSMNDALSAYYCHLCGAEYVIKFNLQQHLENAHTQEERETVPDHLIKCTTCAAIFCSKRAYDAHNIFHQPEDRYVTSEQQRLQTVTKVDQDFDISRVEPIADKYLTKHMSPKRPAKRWPERKKVQRVSSKRVYGDFTSSEEDDEGPHQQQIGDADLSDSSDTSDSKSDLPLDQRIKSS